MIGTSDDHVLGVKGNQVRVGINAPKSVAVHVKRFTSASSANRKILTQATTAVPSARANTRPPEAHSASWPAMPRTSIGAVDSDPAYALITTDLSTALEASMREVAFSRRALRSNAKVAMLPGTIIAVQLSLLVPALASWLFVSREVYEQKANGSGRVVVSLAKAPAVPKLSTPIIRLRLHTEISNDLLGLRS